MGTRPNETGRTSPSWMSCKNCNVRFRGELLVDVEVEAFVRSLRSIRCPSCGSDNLALGAAVDLLLDRTLRTVEDTALAEERIRDWIEGGDVGASSRALVLRLFEPDPTDHTQNISPIPSDPQDLRRILVLLDRIPEIRTRLNEARDISPEWARLIDRFDEIERTFIEEVGPDLEAGSAPRTMKMLQGLRG